MKNRSKSRKLKKIAAILFWIVILASITLYIIFYNEINTLMSIRKISNKPAYSMTYYGDYAMAKYMKTGAEDWDGVLSFMNINLAHGVGRYLYGEKNCSSFFAITPDDHYIIGRNLDTQEVTPAVIRTTSHKGIQTLGMSNLARGGWTEGSMLSKLTVISSPFYTLDGMNEYGLAVASSSVPDYFELGIDDDRITIHDLTVNRLILDNAKNVDDAIQLLKNYSIKMEKTYPSHYMIADDTGKCVVIEFVNGEMQCINKTGDYQIASNFLLSSFVDGESIPCNRYQSYDATLKTAEGRLTIPETLTLLKENTIEGQEQWSVVYDLTAKTMTLTFANDYSKEYFFELNEKEK